MHRNNIKTDSLDLEIRRHVKKKFWNAKEFDLPISNTHRATLRCTFPHYMLLTLMFCLKVTRHIAHSRFVSMLFMCISKHIKTAKNVSTKSKTLLFENKLTHFKVKEYIKTMKLETNRVSSEEFHKK